MEHQGTKGLETNRLILRRFEHKDSAAMYRNWGSDKAVVKYLTWPLHTSEEVSRKIIEEWVVNYSNNSYYNWAIVPKDNNDEPIGGISVVNINEDLSIMEIGYCIGSRWWHKRYTSEALKAVIDFLFDEVKANRIEARHDPRNPNSGKVMAKCGMKYEGTLRCRDRNNQGVCDACYYGLLRSEVAGAEKNYLRTYKI